MGPFGSHHSRARRSKRATSPGSIVEEAAMPLFLPRAIPGRKPPGPRLLWGAPPAPMLLQPQPWTGAWRRLHFRSMHLPADPDWRDLLAIGFDRLRAFRSYAW